MDPNGTATYQSVRSNVKCADPVGQYWQYFNYTWSCCLCPPGWVTVNIPPLYCDAFKSCVRCSGADEELQFVPVPGGGAQRVATCITTTMSSTSTSTPTSTTSSTLPPATSEACGSNGKRNALTGRVEACIVCPDLTTLKDPQIAGSQTVINTGFVEKVKSMKVCALAGGWKQLYDASSSRCYLSKGSYAGTLPSAHMVSLVPSRVLNSPELRNSVSCNLMLIAP
jgi:hypothetical protein